MHYLDICPCCGDKSSPIWRDESKFPGRFLCQKCCPPSKTTFEEDMIAMKIPKERWNKFVPYKSTGTGTCEVCCIL